MADDNEQMGRRRFFRDGLFEMLKPISKPLERKLAPFERMADELRKLEDGQPATQNTGPVNYGPHFEQSYQTYALPVLRPPGALAEDKFIDTCSRCGMCVSVCPANAIQLDHASITGNGVPFIDAEVQPCVVCDSLACMKQCPSGALGYLPRWLIDMGTAVWHRESCTRPHGDTCTTCIDHCPLGSEAIELVGNDIHVKEQGCTGCGVCQYYCPTYPKSIIVKPKSQKVKELQV